MRTYGYSVSGGLLIGYRQFAGDEDAFAYAHDLADTRGEAIEVWLDGSDPDEPALYVAEPKGS